MSRRSVLPGVRGLVFLTVAAGSASCTHARPSSLAWHPQLDQPIRQLEEVLAATSQQQPLNYTSANLGFLLDAKLYLLFERSVATMRAAERARAMDEQRLWLAERKRATHVAYAEYDGGTLASLVGNRKYIELTRERIAVLETALRVSC